MLLYLGVDAIQRSAMHPQSQAAYEVHVQRAVVGYLAGARTTACEEEEEQKKQKEVCREQKERAKGEWGE